MHRRFHPDDVPLPARSGTRDLADPNRQTTQPALDFPVGQTFERDAFLQSGQSFTTRGRIRVVEANIPFARRRRHSFGPPSEPVAQPAIQSAALLGFSPFAGLLPMRVARRLRRAGPACCSPNRSPRLIFVAESSVQRSSDLKRTGDHEFFGSASRLHSRHRSARRGFLSTSSDPAMGFASCRTSGTSSVQPRGHDPAWIISLRKPFPAPIRSWV
jgi:hypothetical protein